MTYAIRMLLGLLALATAGGCIGVRSEMPAPTVAVPTKSVRFMAGYKPQANLPFVGVYVAQANGYFAQQALNVEITHATGQGEHLKLLLQGSVDVTTAAAEFALARRAENLPVTTFALLGQRSQLAFAVLENSEIRSPRDWEGRTVGYKVTPSPEYLAMLAANGVDRSRIQEVPVGFDPRLLAANKVDVYPLFESNEPNTLARLGVPVRLFRPTDYGVPGLGLTYLTRQALAQDDPDLLARFLKATLKGIEWARERPEAATDIVMQFAPQEERAQQLAMLQVELDMAVSGGDAARGIGWGSRERWQALHDSLLAFGGLSGAVDVDTVYTDRILNLVYRDGQLVWP